MKHDWPRRTHFRENVRTESKWLAEGMPMRKAIEESNTQTGESPEYITSVKWFGKLTPDSMIIRLCI